MNKDPEIFDAIDRTAPIDLLAKLVQIPSHPGVPTPGGRSCRRPGGVSSSGVVCDRNSRKSSPAVPT